MSPKLNEAIILAGGLGTRLKETVPDLPKCMAPVAGQPFLFYIINYLRSQGIERFIFSLGYKHEIVEDYLSKRFSTLHYTAVIENEPLGTGGAIRLALEKAESENVLIANGDTLFKVDVSELYNFHLNADADCTLAVKAMKDFNRYGVVETDGHGTVTGFKEKAHYDNGLINGGIYILSVRKFFHNKWPEKFSFEKDYLEKEFPKGKIKASKQDGYFIDIGIPEDYNQAQSDLRLPPLDLKKIDSSWTLFIDRDGVINHEKKEDYIRNVDEFRFYDGVEKAFADLASRFGKIIVVSNQRGVGRNLMTEDSLLDIHTHMKNAIVNAGGRIDKIFYCTSTDNKHPDRKPNPGMAHRAAREIPGIDMSKSIMIGNKPSDMLFGRSAGMYTVYVRTTNPETPIPHPDIDLVFNDLPAFVKAL